MRAMVLSGGGAHGAIQAGALDYLVNVKGLDFQTLCGVSTGTLTAAMLAQALPDKLGDQVKALRALYEGLRTDSAVYTKRFLGELGLVIHSSINDTHPIARLIGKEVDPAKLKASGRQLRFGTVCLETGAYVTWTEQSPEVLSAILASASMPIYFPPVEINGLRYCDGGVTHVTPLADAFATQPDEIWVLLCDTIAPPLKDSSSFSTGLPILERVTDLLIRDVFLTDIQHAIDINGDIVTLAGGVPTGQQPVVSALSTNGKRYVPLYVVMPTQLAGDTLEFNETDIAANLAHGFNVAQKPLDQAAVSALLATAGA
jgi:NTE family protein